MLTTISQRYCFPIFTGIGLVALLWTGTLEAAQHLTRLANDEPEIRVKAEGRTGVCDVLAFLPDGSALMAVGEDKVIHRWGVGEASLRPTRQPIYWNTFREQRGSIYAMALSTADPAHTLVAIGGNGKLNPDVAVFDLRTGQLFGAVTPLCDKPGEYEHAGEAVWSLAFHPKNSELAIGDECGSVWVCPLAAGKPITAQSKRVVTGKAEVAYEHRVVWVGYSADAKLLYAKRDGGVYAVGQAAPLFRWKMGLVDKVVASGDGRVLAARPAYDNPDGTQVEIRSLAGGAGQVVPFKHKHFPNRIALDKSGARLAVGVSMYADGAKKPFAFEPPGEVHIYDIQGGSRLIASRDVAARPDQIAFHPDGKRLATADSLDHATTLWAIDGNQLKVLDREASCSPQLWDVGLTADNRYLCFKDRHNPFPSHPNERADPKDTWTTFDLSGEMRGWVARGKSPVPPENSRGGWKIRFDPVNDYKWFVVEPGGREHKLPLDELIDDKPRCFTFLPGGKAGSVRLAVGHAWGASVFELVAGQVPDLIRRFNGHAGYVTAIAPTHGGKGLVTCGRDHAIAIWNLADFPSEPLLGASFFADKGKIVVKTVDRGSPADEAGLSVGDEITSYIRGDSPKPVPRERWLADFLDPQPKREMLWGIDRTGLGANVDKRAKTALLHRPAAKFVPFTNGEWLLYTYRQSYYDCSANGDHYIEWLVSKDRADKKPDVFAVEQFAKFLFKPEKVSDVITRFAREPAKPLLPDLFPPTVTLKSDVAQVGPGQEATITVTVVPSSRQDGKVNPVTRVELWLNKHLRVGVDGLAGKKFEVGVPITVTFKVPAARLKSGVNEVRARGIGSDDPGTGCGSGISAALRLTLTAPVQERRLFVLVAGIGNYEGFGNDLPGASADAKRVAERWEVVRKFGGYVADKASEPRFLVDKAATKTRILGEMKEIAKIARPDDTFVLCLAGHGINFSTSMEQPKEGQPFDWYFVIPRNDESVLVPNDFKDAAKLRQAFVKDSELASILISMNCQPVVLLDCCHSGTAVTKTLAARNTSGRGLTQNGFGPVVISSCAVNQKAWEDLKLFGGGVFSYNVLRATGEKFGDADKNNDGKLSVLEFFQYVESGTSRDVGQLTDSLGQSLVQQPKIIPPAEDLKDLIIINQPVPKPKP